MSQDEAQAWRHAVCEAGLLYISVLVVAFCGPHATATGFLSKAPCDNSASPCTWSSQSNPCHCRWRPREDGPCQGSPLRVVPATAGGGPVRTASVKAVVDAGVAVMGHIGLTPQSISVLGGFSPQGRTAAAALRAVRDAKVGRSTAPLLHELCVTTTTFTCRKHQFLDECVVNRLSSLNRGDGSMQVAQHPFPFLPEVAGRLWSGGVLLCCLSTD